MENDNMTNVEEFLVLLATGLASYTNFDEFLIFPCLRRINFMKFWSNFMN